MSCVIRVTIGYSPSPEDTAVPQEEDEQQEQDATHDKDADHPALYAVTIWVWIWTLAGVAVGSVHTLIGPHARRVGTLVYVGLAVGAWVQIWS